MNTTERELVILAPSTTRDVIDYLAMLGYEALPDDSMTLISKDDAVVLYVGEQTLRLSDDPGLPLRDATVRIGFDATTDEASVRAVSNLFEAFKNSPWRVLWTEECMDKLVASHGIPEVKLSA